MARKSRKPVHAVEKPNVKRLGLFLSEVRIPKRNPTSDTDEVNIPPQKRVKIESQTPDGPHSTESVSEKEEDAATSEPEQVPIPKTGILDMPTELHLMIMERLDFDNLRNLSFAYPLVSYELYEYFLLKAWYGKLKVLQDRLDALLWYEEDLHARRRLLDHNEMAEDCQNDITTHFEWAMYRLLESDQPMGPLLERTLNAMVSSVSDATEKEKQERKAVLVTAMIGEFCTSLHGIIQSTEKNVDGDGKEIVIRTPAFKDEKKRSVLLLDELLSRFGKFPESHMMEHSDWERIWFCLTDATSCAQEFAKFEYFEPFLRHTLLHDPTITEITAETEVYGLPVSGLIWYAFEDGIMPDPNRPSFYGDQLEFIKKILEYFPWAANMKLEPRILRPEVPEGTDLTTGLMLYSFRELRKATLLSAEKEKAASLGVPLDKEAAEDSTCVDAAILKDVLRLLAAHGANLDKALDACVSMLEGNPHGLQEGFYTRGEITYEERRFGNDLCHWDYLTKLSYTAEYAVLLLELGANPNSITRPGGPGAPVQTVSPDREWSPFRPDLKSLPWSEDLFYAFLNAGYDWTLEHASYWEGIRGPLATLIKGVCYDWEWIPNWSENFSFDKLGSVNKKYLAMLKAYLEKKPEVMLDAPEKWVKALKEAERRGDKEFRKCLEQLHRAALHKRRREGEAK
ncbi:hypothetical protein BJ508DRAFT_411603 [Ascobolus immersus RN42]|uniref:F-box domain-containing protein n=1 Tax=Ascobolus immersus RN42 TaxID=1160509 RepID=A0A3N4IP53_ASCIM|nr:hypothetical protein BJ508DRAFT_411603 [Ascobolus immersus RN42]